MSTNIEIHRVASVEHTLVMGTNCCWHTLVFHDDAGQRTELVLYRPAGKPLELATPTIRDIGWSVSENNPANYPAEAV